MRADVDCWLSVGACAPRGTPDASSGSHDSGEKAVWAGGLRAPPSVQVPMELGNPGQDYGVMVIRGSRSSEAKAGIGIDPLIIRLG